MALWITQYYYYIISINNQVLLKAESKTNTTSTNS